MTVKHVVGVPKLHDGGVDIAVLRDLRRDLHAALRVHLDDLAARHEPRHVEVVTGHVEEDAAGHGDVLEGRGRRVARRDADEMQRPEVTAGHGVAHRPVAWVEAAVEPDLQQRARRPRPRRALGSPRRGRARSASRRRSPSRPRASHEQVDMRVGAAADGDGIDVRSSPRTSSTEDATRAPSCRADLRCECRHGVVHRGQRRAGNAASEKLCMHATDAPTSEDTDAHSRRRSLFTIRFAGSASRSTIASRAAWTASRSLVSGTPTSQNAPPSVQASGSVSITMTVV